jgi:hypothetical protein
MAGGPDPFSSWGDDVTRAAPVAATPMVAKIRRRSKSPRHLLAVVVVVCAAAVAAVALVSSSSAQGSGQAALARLHAPSGFGQAKTPCTNPTSGTPNVCFARGLSVATSANLLEKWVRAEHLTPLPHYGIGIQCDLVNPARPPHPDTEQSDSRPRRALDAWSILGVCGVGGEAGGTVG